jgi:transcriptional regulator with XRE-family HTH domain
MAIMRKKGLTAAKLADYLEVDPSHVAKVKKGVSKFSPEKTAKLAQLVNVDIEYFYDDNAIPLDELELTRTAKQLLSESDTLSYLVQVDNAKKAGITPAELEEFIKFATALKKHQT